MHTHLAWILLFLACYKHLRVCVGLPAWNSTDYPYTYGHRHGAGDVVASDPNVLFASYYDAYSVAHPAASPRPRILLLSVDGLGGVSVRMGSRYEAQAAFEALIITRHCYASQHGYDVIIDTNQYNRDLTWPLDEYGTRDPLPPHFNKVVALRKYLPHYDWILQLDHDQWLTGGDRRVEDFLDEFERQGANVHLFVPTDLALEPERKYSFSNSVFLVRGSDFGERLLDTWWKWGVEEAGCRYRHYTKKRFIGNDQRWMWYAMVAMYGEWKGLPISAIPCLDQCSTSVSLQTCIDRTFKADHYQQGHEGPLLEGVGPFIFSARTSSGESGLGLEANWALNRKKDPEGVALLEEHAFSMHAKPPNNPSYRSIVLGEMLPRCLRERCSFTRLDPEALAGKEARGGSAFGVAVTCRATPVQQAAEVLSS